MTRAHTRREMASSCPPGCMTFTYERDPNRPLRLRHHFPGRDYAVQVELADRHRAAEKIALHQVDARGTHVFELLFRLDALGGRNGAEPLRESERRGNDRLAVSATENALRERFVDLDLVERKVRQIIDGRIAGAKSSSAMDIPRFLSWRIVVR